MSRREKLISAALNGKTGDNEAKYLNAVVKLVLSDMGNLYLQFWEAEGAGVICFQPDNKERSMFYMTLEELHAAQESCEREDNGDLAETFRRILQAAQKLDPAESAGYIINDAEGIRYFSIDYNKTSEKK
jgi:hypothetical protein